MTHTHAKGQGQRSLGSKVKSGMDRGDCFTFSDNAVNKKNYHLCDKILTSFVLIIVGARFLLFRNLATSINQSINLFCHTQTQLAVITKYQIHLDYV